jgi:hypothetical protein
MHYKDRDGILYISGGLMVWWSGDSLKVATDRQTGAQFPDAEGWIYTQRSPVPHCIRKKEFAM